MRLLALLSITSALAAQTALQPVQIGGCLGSVNPQLLILPGTSAASPLPMFGFLCVQLDPAGFKLDATTNPPTLRAITTAPVMPIFVDGEIPSGAINGTNQSFTLANTPSQGSLQLYVNGLRATQCSGSVTITPGTVTPCDYNLAGATITFLTLPSGTIVPQVGDFLLADYRH
jgi:hypothetical protein